MRTHSLPYACLCLLAVCPLLAAPPDKPPHTIWLEGEAPAATNFPGKPVKSTIEWKDHAPMTDAYGGKALALSTGDEPPADPGYYFADYVFDLPKPDDCYIHLATTPHGTAWTSDAMLVIDGKQRLDMGGVHHLKGEWSPAPTRPEAKLLGWGTLGPVALAAGRHTLSFRVQQRRALKDRNFNFWVDAVAIEPLSRPLKRTLYLPFDGSPDAQDTPPGAQVTPFGRITYRPGKKGRAAWFEPEAGVEVNTKGVLDLARGTVMFWVQFDAALTGRKNWVRLWDMTYREGNANAIRTLINETNGTLYSALNSAGVMRPASPKDTPWKPGEWHHVALRWCRTGATMFYDGREVARNTYVPPEGLSEAFYVGNDYTRKRGPRALIDEFQVLTEALSDRQIAKLAGAPKPKIDARNRLRNSSFEIGHGHWSQFVTWHTGVRVHPDDSAAVHGRRSLCIDTRSVEPGSKGSVRLFSEWHTLSPGVPATAAVYFKTDLPGALATLRVQNGVIHGLLASGAVTYRGVARTAMLTKEWKRCTISTFLPAAYKSSYRLDLRFPLGCRVWVDAAELHEGPPEDYAPCADAELACKLDEAHHTYDIGATVRGSFPLWTREALPGDARLRGTIVDHAGQSVQSVDLDAHGPTAFHFTPPRRGVYRIQCDLVSAGRCMATCETSLGVIQPLGRVPIHDESLFGMHVFEANMAYELPRMRRVGVQSVRLIGLLTWPGIEPKRGAFSFPDEIVARYRREGFSMLAVQGQSPQWARDVPEGRKWRFGDIGPRDMRDVERYTYRLGQHCRGAVQWWEFWNEPNCLAFGKAPQRYAPACRAAYMGLKRADPSARLAVASLATIRDHARRWAGEAFAAGTLRWTDVVSIHPYNKGPADTDSTLGDFADLKRMILRHAGRPMALWNSEHGYYGTDYLDTNLPYFPECHKAADEMTQAAWLVRSYVLERLQGVEKYYWYMWYAERGDVGPDVHGLVRWQWPYAPKAAMVAYNAMVERLLRARLVRRVDTGSKGDWHVLLRRGRETIRVLWTTGEPHAVALPPPTATRRVFDLMGNATEQGHEPIRLTGAPVYVVDG